jgi:hypothetical protein
MPRAMGAFVDDFSCRAADRIRSRRRRSSRSAVADGGFQFGLQLGPLTARGHAPCTAQRPTQTSTSLLPEPRRRSEKGHHRESDDAPQLLSGGISRGVRRARGRGNRRRDLQRGRVAARGASHPRRRRAASGAVAEVAQGRMGQRTERRRSRPHRPRHTVEECRRIFAAIIDPRVDPRIRLAIECRTGQVLAALAGCLSCRRTS